LPLPSGFLGTCFFFLPPPLIFKLPSPGRCTIHDPQILLNFPSTEPSFPPPLSRLFSVRPRCASLFFCIPCFLYLLSFSNCGVRFYGFFFIPECIFWQASAQFFSGSLTPGFFYRVCAQGLVCVFRRDWCVGLTLFSFHCGFFCLLSS